MELNDKITTEENAQRTNISHKTHKGRKAERPHTAAATWKKARRQKTNIGISQKCQKKNIQRQ